MCIALHSYYDVAKVCKMTSLDMYNWPMDDTQEHMFNFCLFLAGLSDAIYDNQ